MYKFLLIIVLLFHAAVAMGQASSILTNAEIIKLHKSKVGDKIIIAKIQSSEVKFDISTDALVSLSTSGVSEAVINSMMEKQTKSDDSAYNLTKSNGTDDGNTFPRSGIYFQTKDKVYTELNPTLVTSTKDEGNCLSNCLLAYGIGTKKNVSSLEGAEANYQLETSPLIYFCFAEGKKDLNKTRSNQDQDYFSQLIGNQTAVSPNEFKLIKLKTQGNSRSYVSGSVKASTGAADVSIADEYIVNFKYTQVAENTYKLTFPNGLAPGEYCFYYLSNKGTNPYAYASYNDIKVYDFGVR
jgi:hypothetical protein